MKNEIEQNIINKKLSKRKYILAAVFLTLLITPALIFIMLSQKQKPDPESEKIIRDIVAKQIEKELNELNDKDFASVRRLDLSGKNVYDISLLEKFINLEELNLGSIPLPEPDIPKWMVILGKFHVNLSSMYIKKYKEKYFIDLSPLEKLSNLKILDIHNTALKALMPLIKIENLRQIDVMLGQFNEYKEYENIKKKLPLIRIMMPGGSEPTLIQDAETRIKSELEK